MRDESLRAGRTYLVGTLLIVIGFVLLFVVSVEPREGNGLVDLLVSIRAWFTIPVGLGVAMLLGTYRSQLLEAERAAAAEAAEPRKPRRVASAVEPPPDVDGDPFRSAPQPPPLAIVHTQAQAAPAPIVPGDPDDKPSVLG